MPVFLGEFREITSPGIVRLLTPSTQATPQLSKPIDQPDSDAVNYVANEAEDTEPEGTVMISAEKPKDPLDKFLSPPPKDKCSDELQVSASR